MNQSITYIIISIGMLFIQQSHAQTIHRWVDSQGQVHYTQLQPEESVGQQINGTADKAKIPPNIPAVKKRNAPIAIEKFESSRAQLINKSVTPTATEQPVRRPKVVISKKVEPSIPIEDVQVAGQSVPEPEIMPATQPEQDKKAEPVNTKVTTIEPDPAKETVLPAEDHAKTTESVAIVENQPVTEPDTPKTEQSTPSEPVVTEKVQSPDYCDLAKRNVDTLQKYQQGSYRDLSMDGSNQVMTKEEIEQEIKQARKAVELYCK